MIDTRQIIVKNGTYPLEQIFIKELQRIIPSDGKFYTLPFEIAIKYKKQLIPVKILPGENEEVNTYTTELKDLKDLYVHDKVEEVIKKETSIITPKKITKRKPAKKKQVRKPVPKKQLPVTEV